MCLCSKQKVETKLENSAPSSVHITPLLEVPPKPKANPMALGKAVKKATERKKVKKSLVQMKSEFEEVQKALGVQPNSALIDRIHSQKQIEKDVSVRKGDTVFSLQELKKAPSPGNSKRSKSGSREDVKMRNSKAKNDDDTLYPTPLQPSKGASVEDEVIEEVHQDEPNSENYMYNEQEIVFVCHDMIRQLQKNDIYEDGELSFMKCDVTQWDPYAPLEELERRECFNCQTLRRNTFLANAISMPTAEERKAVSKLKSPSRVTFSENTYDITNWENPRSLWKTQSESALDLVKTQDAVTKEITEGQPKASPGTTTSPKPAVEITKSPGKITDCSGTQRTSNETKTTLRTAEEAKQSKINSEPETTTPL